MSEDMAEAIDLPRLVKYIAAREETLSNYSDKLRQSLVAIAKIFGSREECQRCGYGMRAHSQDDDHDFVPRIHISIDIDDSEAFYETEDYAYKLTVVDSELRILQYDKLYPDIARTYPFNAVSRKVLKELVKSGRLAKFFHLLAERLQQLGEEYRDVSEVAEKMAATILTT